MNNSIIYLKHKLNTTQSFGINPATFQLYVNAAIPPSISTRNRLTHLPTYNNKTDRMYEYALHTHAYKSMYTFIT